MIPEGIAVTVVILKCFEVLKTSAQLMEVSAPLKL
jgi:hypothetical protein